MEAIGFWQSLHAQATRRSSGILEGPIDPQNLATLPTVLCLATTLLNWNFALESPKWMCVYCNQGCGGVYIGVQGQFHHLRRHGSMKVDGQAATMWATDHAL
jgi:hypothetical protein